MVSRVHPPSLKVSHPRMLQPIPWCGAGRAEAGVGRRLESPEFSIPAPPLSPSPTRLCTCSFRKAAHPCELQHDLLRSSSFQTGLGVEWDRVRLAGHRSERVIARPSLSQAFTGAPTCGRSPAILLHRFRSVGGGAPDAALLTAPRRGRLRSRMDRVLSPMAPRQWLSISSLGDSPVDLARIGPGRNPVLLQAAWASVFWVSPREAPPS